MGTPAPPTTPVRPGIARVQNADTPITRKQTPEYHGTEYVVDASRDALMNDLGVAIPEVPLQFFKDNVFPRLPAAVDTTKIVSALQKAGHITQNGLWKAFGKSPSSFTDEPATFNRLGDVVAAIIECSGLGVDTLTVDYVSRPHTAPLCDYVKKDNRPDAFMVFRTETRDATVGRRHVYWREICCPAEFKLKNDQKNLADVS